MTDPISDLLTRVRNAQAVGKSTTLVPYSKLLWNIAKLLEKEGYISGVEKRGRKVTRWIELTLRYDEGKSPQIQGVRRISRPGRRMYKKTTEIQPVKDNHGMSIVSTSKGLMTNREATKSKLGGELMFEIW